MKVPDDRDADDAKAESRAQPLERKPGGKQHNERNHEILDRHTGIARSDDDRAHHNQRVQTDDKQPAPLADMVFNFRDMRGKRENKNQLAELARLQAGHAQIEPCALAVDLRYPAV